VTLGWRQQPPNPKVQGSTPLRAQHHVVQIQQGRWQTPYGSRGSDSLMGLLTKAFIEAGDSRFVRNATAQPVSTTDWHSDVVIEAM
jgi:hypothetical protein